MEPLNSKEELRPIGSEFEYVYPPSQFSGTPRFSVYTYKVTAHSLLSPYGLHSRPVWGETLEAIAGREESPVCTLGFDGSISWESENFIWHGYGAVTWKQTASAP